MSGHSRTEIPEQKRQVEMLTSREHGYRVTSHRPFCRSSMERSQRHVAADKEPAPNQRTDALQNHAVLIEGCEYEWNRKLGSCITLL